MKKSISRHSIVVGIDASGSHDGALDWAAFRAEQTHRPLVLVHALDDTWAMPEYVFFEELRSNARSVLEKAARRVEDVAPSVRVDSQLHLGSPIQILSDLSEDAELIVVGGHRKGRLEGVIAGTASVGVATRSRCSVAAVPDGDWTTGRSGVVVGVDGSRHALGAVAQAAAEADRLGQELRVVYSFVPVDQWAYSFIDDATFTKRLTDEERVVLGESVAGLTDRYPDLTVSQHLDTKNLPAEALITAAATAQLLVIGSRGRSMLHRRYLGSVAHKVLLRLPCPTIVSRAVEP